MKKIFTLFVSALVTISMHSQTIWEGSFEPTTWYAIGSSVNGVTSWNTKITDDAYWNTIWCDKNSRDNSVTITDDANTGSQALEIQINRNNLNNRMRSAASDYTNGDLIKITYSAKTDAAGVARGGKLMGLTKGVFENNLTTSYQQFVEYGLIANGRVQIWFLNATDADGQAYKIWLDDVKIEYQAGPDMSVSLPVTDGFENADNYQSSFNVVGQTSWVTSNPSSIWKDIFSTAASGDKTYVSSIVSDGRPGSGGSQCMKFDIKDAAFTPGDIINDVPTVKLRSNALDNIIEGNNYVIRLWAKTTDAPGEAAISATNIDFKPITNTWTEYELPYVGLASKLAQICFKGIGKDYNVLIDDVTIEVNSSTAINDLFESSTFAIYPNPASSKLFIQSEETISGIEIYSIAGQKVLESTQVINGIDISNLSNGLYIVSATINGQSVQQKFTKR